MECSGFIGSCERCYEPCRINYKKSLKPKTAECATAPGNDVRKVCCNNKVDNEHQKTYMSSKTQDLNRGDFRCELDTFGRKNDKCFRCKCLLENVYTLLEELSTLRKQEGIGLCDHCKHNTCDIDCPKCQYVIKKFLAAKKEAREEYNTERVKMWLHKFRHLLGSLFAGECTRKTVPCKKKYTDEELDKLLQNLKEPQETRDLDIEVLFPSPSKQAGYNIWGDCQDKLKNKGKKGLVKKGGAKKGAKNAKGGKEKGDKSKDKTDTKDKQGLETALGRNLGLSDNKKRSKRRKRKVLVTSPPHTESEDDLLKCSFASEMILGNEIVPYQPKKRVKRLRRKPLYFRVFYDANDIAETNSAPSSESVMYDKNKMSEKPPAKKVPFLSYALSNLEFVEKKLTVLPRQTIMQKIVLYRMVPSKPEMDWFSVNADKMPLHYETGQLLAKSEGDKWGCWFYKSKKVALAYYNDEENNELRRYEVYSTGKGVNGLDYPITVLAVFDFCGNCVVYDSGGNVRLKYNQAEGVTYDQTIGPRNRWKWHNLNQPPEIHLDLIDKTSTEECITKLEEEEEKPEAIPLDEKMITVEYENCIKQNKIKNMKSFKPFSIRSKIFKINEHFSLRIIDQHNVYLTFRDEETTMKLHLGLMLITNEIVNVTMTEVRNVLTPYDDIPPTTELLNNIKI